MSDDWNARAIRRQEAEEALYPILAYIQAKTDRDKSFSDFDGPFPGYWLHDKTEAAEQSAMDALDALEKLIDRRVEAALRNRKE